MDKIKENIVSIENSPVQCWENSYEWGFIMNDEDKSKGQLINDLNELRKQNAQLKISKLSLLGGFFVISGYALKSIVYYAPLIGWSLGFLLSLVTLIVAAKLKK